jgi:hypothetical protein
MSVGFIGDGYTEQGYIAEVPRLHPAMRFKFRPFLQEDRSRLLNENDKLKAIQATANTAVKLADKLIEWDLKDAAGEPVTKDDKSIRRLKPALYMRLLGIVMGLDASDEDPDAKAATDDDAPSLADHIEAHDTKRPVGDVAQENATKN